MLLRKIVALSCVATVLVIGPARAQDACRQVFDQFQEERKTYIGYSPNFFYEKPLEQLARFCERADERILYPECAALPAEALKLAPKIEEHESYISSYRRKLATYQNIRSDFARDCSRAITAESYSNIIAEIDKNIAYNRDRIEPIETAIQLIRYALAYQPASLTGVSENIHRLNLSIQDRYLKEQIEWARSTAEVAHITKPEMVEVVDDFFFDTHSVKLRLTQPEVSGVLKEDYILELDIKRVRSSGTTHIQLSQPLSELEFHIEVEDAYDLYIPTIDFRCREGDCLTKTVNGKVFDSRETYPLPIPNADDLFVKLLLLKYVTSR